MSETFFDSSFLPGDERLRLNGYNLIRNDHPGDVKRGGVCVYIKDSLATRICNVSRLTECIIIELIINNKKGYIMSLYRSPSQTNDKFDNFLKNFDHTLNQINSLNPSFVMILGDFNAKSSSWCTDDLTSNEGFQVETVTSFYGFTQLISTPTHILPNSSSCIDLIFTDQPSIIMNSGVHSSLHPNCHHQIIFANVNLRIEYPPPYERIVWDYKNAHVQYIHQSIHNFNWENLFLGKNANEKVCHFTRTILNIFKNFIPNKTTTFNDSDPPWITDQIKNLISLKNQMLQLYLQNGKKNNEYILIQSSTKTLSNLIEVSKKNYFDHLSAKLNNPKTSAKAYWKIVKSFVNGKRIPSIPPLFVNGHFVTNFSNKADIFNNFFALQCKTIDNSSVTPNHANFTNDKRLSNLNFDINDITNIIHKLNPNKAHGHDGISIRMVQVSCDSIAKPLFLIFKHCFETSTFPMEWKKGNIVPVHKKGDKNLVSNYRPISLLPIFSKIFERIIFDTLYKYLEDNNFFNSNQSGFRPGDSCIHQLISITHDIYRSYDANPTQEVRGLFLDISKAFDRVWHEGLLYKLKNLGIEGKFLFLIESFLSDRYQRVTLNGQTSDWAPVEAGVPQGSILGPLLFLCYINDLPDGLISNVKLFADDTALFSNVTSPIESYNILNHDLTKITDWAFQWKMLFNPDITKQAKEIVFSRKVIKTNHPQIYFNNTPVKTCSSEKHLGLILDKKLDFKLHVHEKINKAMKLVGTIKKLSYILPRTSLITIYKSFVRPHLDYGDVIYDQPTNQAFSEKLESVQYNAALAITGAFRGTSRNKLYSELGFESLKDRRWMRRLCYFFRIFNNSSPSYLSIYLPPLTISQRYPNIFNSFFCRTTAFQNSFFPSSVNYWNQLDVETRNYKSYPIFRKKLLKIVRPSENSVFNVCDPLGIKLLSRLRLGFSHLREHKFRHNFSDTINPLCTCTLEPETTIHFLLHCRNYSNARITLMSDLHIIDSSIMLLNDTNLVQLLLFGNSNYSFNTNKNILIASIKYIKNSLRFEEQLF